MLKLLKALYHDEAGQAYTEYFLIVVSTAIVIGAAFQQFNRVVDDIYENVVRWVTLPIP